MTPQPPPGRGPIDPQGVFSPPPPPPPLQGSGGNWQPPASMPPQGMPPMMPPPPGGPPMMMPPSPMWGPPPPPRERSFARAIFMTLATTIFGLSLALNVYLLLFSGLLGAGTSQQNALREGDRQQTVAVIPIVGPIYADGSARFNRFMSLAENDPTVKAIVIEVDSPGGTVTASDEIYHRILKFRAEHPNIPIITSMSSLGASGGYYVACATPEIYAQPTTITGSIGVMMPNYNFSGLMEEWGIADTSIVAEGAFYKDVGSPTTRPVAQKTEHLQELADAMFKQFKDIVVQGRQGVLKANIEDVANGKVFLADEALKLGLIDKVGYLEDAYSAVAAKAGLSSPNVVRYQDPPTLFDVLSADSSVPPLNASVASSVKSVSINGVNVNVDLGSLSELTTPRLMYLWRGQ